MTSSAYPLFVDHPHTGAVRLPLTPTKWRHPARESGFTDMVYHTQSPLPDEAYKRVRPSLRSGFNDVTTLPPEPN